MSSLVNILGILLSICGQRTVANDIATELRKSHSSKNLGDGRDETLTKTDYDGRNTKSETYNDATCSAADTGSSADGSIAEALSSVVDPVSSAVQINLTLVHDVDTANTKINVA